jgi:hypothetical protein
MIILRAQPAEGEAVAAARLLDQRGHAQRAENAVTRLAHVILDGQHEAGGQLPQRRTRAGEGGAVGEKASLGQQMIEGVGGRARRRRVRAPPGHM